MRSLILAAAYLACTTLAQTPFNFTPPVSGALNVEYAETDVTPGTVLTGRSMLLLLVLHPNIHIASPPLNIHTDNHRQCRKTPPQSAAPNP